MPEPFNNPHYKPSKEELEEENKRIIAEAEALADEEEEEEQEEEKEEKETPEENQEEEEEVEEEEKTVVTPTEEEEEEQEEKETPEEKPKNDLEEKYNNSTIEAQRLYRNNAIMNEAIAEANSLPEPTEDELKAAYKDWELYDDDQKETKKELFINKRFREHINEASKEIRGIQEWHDRVEKFVEDPQTLIKYPELEGKTKIEQFKLYASDKSVQGTNFETLVNSFLYELSKSAKPKHKGQMFETGKGGPNEKPKPKSDKLSIAESATLAKTNYKLYIEYLRAGKISTEVD